MLTLEEMKAAMEATGFPFAICGWKNATAETYGVIAPDVPTTLWGDGKIQEQSAAGTVHLFTKDPSGAPKIAVMWVFESLDISRYLNSVQYEQDTGYIHYEWVWESV